jgi:hypothetical protein
MLLAGMAFIAAAGYEFHMKENFTRAGLFLTGGLFLGLPGGIFNLTTNE